MFIVDNYALAVVLCIITMICWGSWGNTQKFVGKSWRFELFYWDYVIGMFLFSLLMAFTLGSHGNVGRDFLTDIQQISGQSWGYALLGGIIFNASNILLSASVSISGMSVAFPLGVGIALVLGVFINYLGTPKGDPLWLFTGVACVVLAIILNGMSANSVSSSENSGKNTNKGILLAALAGVCMSLFYRFVAESMDVENFISPQQGLSTPYTAFVIFSSGVLLSNFVFNTLIMKKPFIGQPTTYRMYFKGDISTHLIGMLGGCIWALGTLFSYIAANKAGSAVSYALGQGAPMIAALWGIFVWKEFHGGTQKTKSYLTLMFIFFILGLGMIVYSGL